MLFIPTVAGGFVLATSAGAFGHRTVGALAFGAALFTWLALESVLLHRLLVHDPLPAPLLPTLGIQLAPPTTAGVAYLALTDGAPGPFALALLGYALLQALILICLTPRIRTQPFTATYWAFPFGLATLATLAIRMVGRGADELGFLALALLLAATATVVAITAGTVGLALDRRLLPPTTASASAAPDAEPRRASRA